MSTNSGRYLVTNTMSPTAATGLSTSTNANMNEEGVIVRSMRLKVLYTFDEQNKTNHLARWPEIIPVQTVAIDSTSLIGVVDLQTCIRAIIQNSPEMVARIGQDYTIYAFDYSEHDTPLVGQGMFSKAIAAISTSQSTPIANAGQLVTGRVCKNIMGIFANGIKETLEVKLRLVPIPLVINTEYLEAMNRYNGSGTSTSVEANEWSAFMANQNLDQMSNRPSPAPSQITNHHDGTSMEVMNQLLQPQILQQQSQMNTIDLNTIADMAGNESRATTNTVGKGKKTSRPSSRASVKRPRGRKPRAATAGGNTSGYEEGTDGDEGPATKKRAKVQKADYANHSAFLGGPDSLHKAATTSGPLRVLRPLAMSPHPPNSALSGVQDVPRAPTPVPSQAPIRRSKSRGTSMPRRESFLAQSRSTNEPIRQISPLQVPEKPEDQLRFSIESAEPSPEKVPSPADSLQEIGSSPPVMRSRPPSRMRSSPQCPSSPDLPQMPRTDSGFMSGSLEDLFGEGEDVQNIDDDDEDAVMLVDYEGRSPMLSQKSPAGQKQPDPTVDVDEIVSQEELSTHSISMLRQSTSKPEGAESCADSASPDDGQALPPLEKASRAPSRATSQPVSHSKDAIQTFPAPIQNQQRNSLVPDVHVNTASRSVPGPRPESRMVRTASMGSLTFPTVPASDPALPPSSLQRSQTWSEAPHPATETPLQPLYMPMYGGPYPAVNYGPPETVYNRVADPKKVQIKQRLEAALAKGEMPPFCSNCGAIQTPTWRKAWSKDFQGEPGYYEYSDQPGCVTAINILTRNEEGKPTSYQIIKKYLAQSENQEDFNEFLLCNPCGIWMSKYKTQRPAERWESNGGFSERGPKGEPKKRNLQRPSKPKKPTNTSTGLPTSEANFPMSEANFPPSEANFVRPESSHPVVEKAGLLDGVSPRDTTASSQVEEVAGQPQHRKNSLRNGKRLNAMTSDAAPAALRQAIQSSPARWADTQPRVADAADDLGSTRRLLFPSPRKDGSPKVLGEVTTNIITISSDGPSLKLITSEIMNQENRRPVAETEHEDAELIKLFEEEMARPSTPTTKSIAINPFKTPTRPTPSHRPITRSVTRSIRSGKSPGQLLLFNRTPSKTPGSRRGQQFHGTFESPFTATLNQLMSEANNQPSPSRGTNGMEVDFGNLPSLPNVASHDNMNMNFNLEDFFSTDVPMPSSPPRINYSLHDDSMAMQHLGDINWDSFGQLQSKDLTDGGENVKAEDGPREWPSKKGTTDERET